MKRTALLLALAAAPVGFIQAADLSYSWIEGDYARVKPDKLPSANAFMLRGSGALGENFNIVASWSHTQREKGYEGGQAWGLGFGYHVPVSDSADLFAEAKYVKAVGYDVKGFDGRVGVRGAAGPNFEGGAAVIVSKVKHQGKAEIGLDLFAEYKFTPAFGLSAELNVVKSGSTVLVGPRLNF